MPRSYYALLITFLAVLLSARADASDGCPATVITTLPFTDSGTTAGFVDDAQGTCLSAAAPDALYSITPAVTNTYTISLCGSGYDTGLIIRSGGNCPGTTQLYCNDDQCGVNSQLIVSLTVNTTYWIVVDGWNGNSGPFTLTVTAPNPGNDCPATNIASLPYTSTGNTCNDGNDFLNCVGNLSRDTVYSYTASANGDLLVSLCSPVTDFDSGLEVRSGGNCPGDNQIACNDDNGPGCSGVASSITFAAVTGTTYFFIVHGFSTACGNYELTVLPPPVTGRCCYSNGQSCTDGIDEATCSSLYFGVFTPNLTCGDPCPCPRDTLLVVRGLPGGSVLTWQTPTTGFDKVWSTLNRNHDGDPNDGLDTMWTLRAYFSVAPGTNTWTETDMFAPRYRAYTVTHSCP